MSLLENLKFEKFVLNDRKETVTSLDETGKYILKISVFENPRKAKTLKEEFETMTYLNSRGCQSCPKAYEFGSVPKSFISLDTGRDLPETLNYIIQEYCIDNENYSLFDLVLSIIEQKKLGVYQGDIKPANVRFNSKSGVCVLIDYDQSISLTKEQTVMSNREFFSFCDEDDKNRYGVGNWLRHFPSAAREYLPRVFIEDALDLSKTSVFRLQKTTNSQSGIYHTIQTRDVVAIGSRSLDTRAKILDAVEFKQGERVLDVGCNAGLLCMYLHDRGCKTTGVDNDPHIVVGAKMVSNIIGKDIHYACVDLDYVDVVEKYDTIMLFSVFHHTRNPEANAKKIVDSCNRIIIETRLMENGKQPVNGQWVDTTRWSFGSLEELVGYLQSTFTGFKFTRNLGFADKGRYVLEMVKQ